MRAIWLAVAILSGVTLPPVASAQAPSPEAIRRALSPIIATHRFQTELPDQTPAPRSETTQPWQAPEAERREQTAPTQDVKPSESPPLVQLLIWLLVIAVIAFVALPAVNELAFRLRRGPVDRSRAAEERREQSAKAGDGMTGDPVAEAHRLAAEGRAAEAIHLLLVAAVRRIEKAGRVRSISFLTNREIAHEVLRDRTGAQAFGRLVALGERIRFAGHDPKDRDVEDSCESYLVFAATMSEAGHG
jgi:hypothetical protein